jgi:hypothetical protein
MQKKKEVSWETFLQAFLKLIKAKSVGESDIRAQCLAAVLDVDKVQFIERPPLI